MRFFAMCLDRPAFIDRFHNERSTEAFDRAIEDTITAFNTGTLRSRDGIVLQTHKGKSYLIDPKLRGHISTVVAILRAIRMRYSDAKRSGEIVATKTAFGEEHYFVGDAELAEWFDINRLQALSLFKSASESIGIDYRFPDEDYARENWKARNSISG